MSGAAERGLALVGLDALATPAGLALGLGLLALGLWWALRRPPDALPWSAWPEARGAGARPDVGRWLAHAARAATLAALAVALAGPVREHRAPPPPGEGLDLVLVLDASDSMNEPAGGGTTKLAAARSAAAGFIDLLTLGPDRAAVVAFNRVARSMTGLTADRASLAAGLAAVATSPGTRIDAGLEAAEALVAAQGRPGARAVVVVLTDGLQAGDVPAATVLDRADRLKAAGARVYPIGLGPTIDRDLMRAVASAPGDFLESPTTADLARAFSAVRDRLACLAP